MENIDGYDILIVTYLILIITGVIKGAGEDRTIVVFKDYDDLGLTFLIPTSFILITYIFSILEVNQTVTTFIAGLISCILFIRLIINTYNINEQNVPKSLLSLLTKMPLAIIWIVSLTNVLNPSGKGQQRSKNRGQAMVILAFLTPIIGSLVVDKSGSYFNPRDWIRGRRVGSSVRNHL